MRREIAESVSPFLIVTTVGFGAGFGLGLGFGRLAVLRELELDDGFRADEEEEVRGVVEATVGV